MARADPPPLEWSILKYGFSRRRTRAKKRKAEEVVSKLRQVDVLVAQGTPVAERDPHDRGDGGDVLPGAGDGGLKSDQVERLKELETENQRLHKAIADLPSTS